MNFFRNQLYKGLGLVMTILALLLSIQSAHFQKPTEFSFSHQISRLDDVQKSLNTLSTFISDQKRQLQQSEKTLANLKSEQEKLKPLVEADKKVVEALLSIQADKQRSSVWPERLIGLFLGVAGSLIASLIWAFVRTRNT